MQDPKEIAHLIYLLDDPDEQIFRQVEQRIHSFGPDAIPYLEEASLEEGEDLRRQRLEQIINQLKQQELLEELKSWRASEEQDLLDALVILNRIEEPDVMRADMDRILDKIKLDAWLELNYDLTSYEQIKILNYILFDVHKFRGNTTDYHHIDNSLIHKVLTEKTGNPVSISIVYALIAQRLNIPVYGVNLPQHFVLGYKSSEGIELLKRFNDPSTVKSNQKGDILFYINPFSEGLVLSYESLKSFLSQLKIDPKPEYFNIASNEEIIKRVLRNMMFSYEKAKQSNKTNLASLMLDLLNQAKDDNLLDHP